MSHSRAHGGCIAALSLTRLQHLLTALVAAVSSAGGASESTARYLRTESFELSAKHNQSGEVVKYEMIKRRPPLKGRDGVELQPAALVRAEKHNFNPLSALGGDTKKKKTAKDKKKKKKGSYASVQAIRATAITLLGGFGSIIGLFYVLNYPHEDVQREIWRTLSATTSLFCAILLYEGVKTVEHLALGIPIANGCSSLSASFSGAVLSFVLLELLVTFSKHYHKALVSWGVLAAHVAAFFNVDYFGGLQQCYPDDATKSAWPIVYAVIFFSIISNLAHIFRSIAAFADSTVDHEEHLWLHHCEELENEAMSFCLGFLVSQVVKFLITGELAPIAGDPKHKGTWEKTALFVVAVNFGLLGIIFDFIRRRQMDKRIVRGNSTWGKWRQKLERMLEMLQSIFSFTMGWCLVHWGKWLFYNNEIDPPDLLLSNKILQMVTLAIVFSVICYFILISVFFLTEGMTHSAESLRTIVQGFVLCMGFYWEKVFFQAIDGVVYPTPDTERNWVCAVYPFLLLVIVLPAWVSFIIPKGLESHHDHHGGEAGDGVHKQGSIYTEHLTHKYHKTTVHDDDCIIHIQRKWRQHHEARKHRSEKAKSHTPSECT